MTRRTMGLLITLALGLLVAPPAAVVQPMGKVPRIGVLVPGEAPSSQEPNLAAFRRALQHLGYREGQTIAVEYRYAHGEAARFGELVAELVARQVDIMVVGSGRAALAAKQATQTIPIVVAGAADPVGIGLVASFARPGGNVTGVAVHPSAEFAGKWVELLKAAAPQISHVAFLYHDPANPVIARHVHDLHLATQALGLTLQPLEVRELDQLDRAFAALSQKEGSALLVLGEPFFFPHRSRIPALVAMYRLPAIYVFRLFVDAGGLMSSGVSLSDVWRRAASYVDKILKGAKPADLPVDQPMKFELVINLKTAQALGLTIPPTLLFQADEVLR
jgi:putative tryptophan/tyrosine transport system substrate-binding protein